jgi:DNA-binding MarR family transcriptional regulator
MSVPAKPRKPLPEVTAQSIDTGRRITYSAGHARGNKAGLDFEANELWRQNNIARLLLFAFQAVESRMIDDHHARGFGNIHQAHMNVLRHIDHPGGTRIVDLAARAGLTKATMGKMVAACKRQGLVTLHADPKDKRAKIVRIATKDGRDAFGVARRSTQRTEEELAKIIGTDRLERLRQDLIDLRTGLIAAPERNDDDER